jgi:hypothetical protein
MEAKPKQPMNKTKIAIIIAVIILGSILVFKWNYDRNQPQIKILKTNETNKQVQFEMTYKGMKFATTMTHGGIRRQIIKGHTFEAVTEGNAIVFSIKNEVGEILATKTIQFNG